MRKNPKKSHDLSGPFTSAIGEMWFLKLLSKVSLIHLLCFMWHHSVEIKYFLGQNYQFSAIKCLIWSTCHFLGWASMNFFSIIMIQLFIFLNHQYDLIQHFHYRIWIANSKICYTCVTFDRNEYVVHSFCVPCLLTRSCLKYFSYSLGVKKVIKWYQTDLWFEKTNVSV